MIVPSIAIYRLGNEAFVAKKYDEAITHYTDGIRLEPDNGVMYSNRRYSTKA